MDNNRNIFKVPNKDGNVWPKDLCPAYTPREDSIECIKGCWYCKYADFHLKDERALEVGVCRWPNRVF